MIPLRSVEKADNGVDGLALVRKIFEFERYGLRTRLSRTINEGMSRV